MNHLTPDAWRRLRDGSLPPPERAALQAHLREACELCDDLALDDLALDAATDRALASLAPAPTEGARLLAPLEARVLAGSFPRPARWRMWVPVALAATAALFFFAPQGPAQREKGDGALPPALTAVVAAQKGAPLAPVVTTRAYPGTAELFFTYVLPRDGHVYLGRVGDDGVVEPFYPAVGQADAVEPAGTHALSIAGTVHGYALEGLRGKQRFVVVTSPEPLDGAARVAALKEQQAAPAALTIEVEAW